MNGKCIVIPKYFATDEANELRKNVDNFINKGEKIFVVDFGQCEFIDITGLGVLLSINKKCNLKLISIKNPSVMKIFEFTRLKKIFEIGE